MYFFLITIKNNSDGYDYREQKTIPFTTFPKDFGGVLKTKIFIKSDKKNFKLCKDINPSLNAIYYKMSNFSVEAM